MYSVLLFYDDHYRGGRAGMTDFPSVELHSFPELFKYKKIKIYVVVFFLYVHCTYTGLENTKNEIKNLQVNLFHSIFS